MKRALAILLAFVLLASAMTGCGGKKTDSEGTDSQATDGQGNVVEYYLFRDLPEATYITPAAEFAGGDGTESDPYQISNAAELALLHEKMVWDSENVKNEYRSACYILTDDIYINDIADFDNWESTAPEYSWTPIGLDADAFKGVFDGKGHTVYGIYINTNCGTADKYSNDNYGLFDTVYGTVKNVIIDKSYFAVSGNECGVGSIAGSLMDEAVIENCGSTAVIMCYDNTCGGIVGKASGGISYGSDSNEAKYSMISECSFSGTITQCRDDAMVRIGGIIGNCDGNVDSCVNSGKLNFTSNNVDSVGGIAGLMDEGTISNCKNEGTLHCEMTGTEKRVIAGGIVGKVFVSATGSEKYMSRGAKIVNCKNSGTVEGQIYAGGIVGQLSNDHNDYCITVSGCTNSGSVSANEYTGGIIGYMNCVGDNENGESIVVENCENKADISNGTVGGIVAQFISETGYVTIKGCSNSGALTAEGQHCGGIIAYWMMNSKPEHCRITVDGCENSGSVTSTVYAGGIISFMDMPVCLEMGNDVELSVVNCKNSGSISVDSVNGYVGGILGNWGMENIPTKLNKCTNSGTLSITASADGMTAEETEIMTVSRIVGGIVGRVGSGLLLTTDNDNASSENIQAADAVLRITNSSNSGKLKVVNEDAEYYKNWFGGIIGNACGEDGFSVLVENCTYSGFDRGLGNENLPDVGTKK